MSTNLAAEIASVLSGALSDSINLEDEIGEIYDAWSLDVSEVCSPEGGGFLIRAEVDGDAQVFLVTVQQLSELARR